MAPRRYDRRRRDESMAETRARIVRAVADLHAELGPSRTTYAMIAARADVAIPTVYKHFPKPAALFQACIGHVSARTRPLGGDLFAGLPTAAARIEALVRALFERHASFAPWLRWSRHEAHLLPDMAVYFVKMRERHLRLVREALAPAFGAEPPRALMALVEALTGFDAWHTLARDNGLEPEEAVGAVMAAIRPMLAREGRGAAARAPLRPRRAEARRRAAG
jgi:AcrR family transcriptional regulator